jgi:hypothetical protein
VRSGVRLAGGGAANVDLGQVLATGIGFAAPLRGRRVSGGGSAVRHLPDRTVRWTVRSAERVIRKDRAGEVEYEIITEVWSYGEQLGCLTDVLLEVVDEMGLESPAVLRLRAKAGEMADGSEAAKNRVRQRVEKAEADLERLERGVRRDSGEAG